MLKTYLYIPHELEEKISLAAKIENKSKAEIIRKAIDSGLQHIKRKPNAGVQALFELEKIGRKYNLRGPKNSSAKMDELLWGKDWSKNED